MLEAHQFAGLSREGSSMTPPPTETRARKAKARKFYLMGPDFGTGSRVGWEMENLQMLLEGRRVLGPPRGSRGIAEFPEPPRLLIDRSIGRAPRDVEQYHEYWLVSDRLKESLAEIDPEGVVFVRCDVFNRDGTKGPIYWLTDVVRVLDAVDEDASRVRIKYYPEDNNRKVYSLLGGANLVFKERDVGTAHIFRMRYSEPYVICRQELRDACKKAGLKGISFKDAANC